MRAALAELSEAARRASGDLAAAFRWVPAGNLHLTLHFLGELDAEPRARLIGALGTSLPEPPVDARLHEIGAFPPSGSPRVLWVSLTAGVALGRVHRLLADRIERAGLPVETRPFSSHVTLARVRDQGRRRVRDLLPLLRSVVVSPAAWRIDRVTLFESDLSGPVPRYAAVHRLALAAS